jgi:hypothetical protein
MLGKRLFPDATVEFKVRCILEFDDADPGLRPIDQADVRLRALLVARQHPCRKLRAPLHTRQAAGFRRTPGVTCNCTVLVHAFQYCKQDLQDGGIVSALDQADHFGQVAPIGHVIRCFISLATVWAAAARIWDSRGG